MMSFITGFSIGLSLIVAIGAQNIWVLSQSMKGANRLIIASVCIICDALLIITGVYSIHIVQQLLPDIVSIMTWAGIALLLWLAYQAAARAINGSSGLQTDQQTVVMSNWKTATTALAITLLNPHVYLDTVVLIGSVGAQQTSAFWFTCGACLASLCWFSGLTTLAPKLKIWLNSSLRWRIFDGMIALVLLLIAASLFPS